MKLTDNAILAIFSNETSRFAPRTLLSLLQFQGCKTSPRTLARRLDDLVKRGELAHEGSTRNLVYRRPMRGGVFVPSPSGLVVLEYIREPRNQRYSDVHERGLLEKYRPNIDSFLPETLRKKLLQHGLVMASKQPAGSYARSILDRFLVDLSWASAFLEDNSYSLLETEELIQTDQFAEGKSPAEAVMIQNHKAAIEWLIQNTPGFDKSTICNLHAFLSQDLLIDHRYEGTLSDKPGFAMLPRLQALSRKGSIGALFDMLVEKANAIADPFEQAFFALVFIPHLHPFIDMNKCVSRLAANIPLIRDNLCPISFVGTPKDEYLASITGVNESYRIELLRDVFEYAYLRSCEQYPVAAGSANSPDQVETQYRDLIRATVHAVVAGTSVDEEQAVERALELVALELQDAFVDHLHRRLDALHEHNLARYQLSVAQFDAWRGRRLLPG